MKRRPVSPFSLSFLDIMFCGFGAVVLLVLILNTDTVRNRENAFADLRSEVVRLERETLVASEGLATARGALLSATEELDATVTEAANASRSLVRLEAEVAALEAETAALRAHNNALSTDLKDLDEKKKVLGEQAEIGKDKGKQILDVTGEGDRQYVTGLKMGGRRVLILLDASASMLDESLVNVLRRRYMSENQRRAAPKWQRAVATAEWLVANLTPGVRFQVYTFDTAARPVAGETMTTWLETAKEEDVASVVRSLRQAVPGGGTSLHSAFEAAAQLAPRPDNIILVTDGLPTQGKSKPRGTTVSGDDRLKHFGGAQKELPSGVPVNTILFPMEGDSYAAAAFWKLALDTRGAFMTPSRDWP
ncbi:MAG: VWA domain-containing protein [Myxococcales bacterium]|nr:MAG: VWA domain-containing protein [Myxococcales bacterium]